MIDKIVSLVHFPEYEHSPLLESCGTVPIPFSNLSWSERDAIEIFRIEIDLFRYLMAIFLFVTRTKEKHINVQEKENYFYRNKGRKKNNELHKYSFSFSLELLASLSYLDFFIVGDELDCSFSLVDFRLLILRSVKTWQSNHFNWDKFFSKKNINLFRLSVTDGKSRDPERLFSGSGRGRDWKASPAGL